MSHIVDVLLVYLVTNPVFFMPNAQQSNQGKAVINLKTKEQELITRYDIQQIVLLVEMLNIIEKRTK